LRGAARLKEGICLPALLDRKQRRRCERDSIVRIRTTFGGFIDEPHHSSVKGRSRAPIISLADEVQVLL
jgi:hypothetical protein